MDEGKERGEQTDRPSFPIPYIYLMLTFEGGTMISKIIIKYPFGGNRANRARARTQNKCRLGRRSAADDKRKSFSVDRKKKKRPLYKRLTPPPFGTNRWALNEHVRQIGIIAVLGLLCLRGNLHQTDKESFDTE